MPWTKKDKFVEPSNLVCDLMITMLLPHGARDMTDSTVVLHSTVEPVCIGLLLSMLETMSICKMSLKCCGKTKACKGVIR